MRHCGDFLEYIKNIKHYSPNTVLSYQKDLEQFFAFIESNDQYDNEVLNHRQIRNWIVYLMENGNSARTVNRKISSHTIFSFIVVHST